MAKSIGDIFGDVASILKLVEVILCLVSLLFLEYSVVFYSRWVLEMLVIATGGYLLICLVMFVCLVLEEPLEGAPAKVLMIIGGCLNIIGGVMCVVRNARRKKVFLWTTIEGGLSSSTDFEIFLAIVAIAAGVVMVIDFIMLLKK